MEKGKKRSNLVVFILIALASALSVFSIQTFLYNRSLVGEIKSMNEKLESLHLISTSKDALSINREVLNLQFKEDFYLNQLNNTTTIILGSLGFVLALGGFLTFKSIDDRFEKNDEIIKRNEDFLNRYIERNNVEFSESMKEIHQVLKDVESKLNKDILNLFFKNLKNEQQKRISNSSIHKTELNNLIEDFLEITLYELQLIYFGEFNDIYYYENEEGNAHRIGYMWKRIKEAREVGAITFNKDSNWLYKSIITEIPKIKKNVSFVKFINECLKELGTDLKNKE